MRIKKATKRLAVAALAMAVCLGNFQISNARAAESINTVSGGDALTIENEQESLIDSLDTESIDNIENIENELSQEDIDTTDQDESERIVDTENNQVVSDVDDVVKEETELTYQTLTESVDNKVIAISGNIPEGAEIDVTEITNISDIETQIESTLENSNSNVTVYEAFDIKIIVDGEKYQPEDFGETVNVKITNIESDGDNSVIFHITDEGSIEQINGTVDSESAEFSASSFSPYVIASISEIDTQSNEFLLILKEAYFGNLIVGAEEKLDTIEIDLSHDGGFDYKLGLFDYQAPNDVFGEDGSLSARCKPGYVFDGWVFEDNTSVIWFDNQTIEENFARAGIDATGLSEVCLIPKWTKSSIVDTDNGNGSGVGIGLGIQVIFSTNGGTPEPEPQMHKGTGEGYVTEPQGVTKTGYKLKNWFFYNNSYDTPKTEIYDFSKTLEENLGDISKYPNVGVIQVVLYANWEEVKERSIQITFDTRGGTPKPEIEIYDISGKEIVKKPETITKSGYEFKGWYYYDRNTNQDKPYNFSKSIIENIGDISKYQILYNGNYNITIYAKWKAENITIILDARDGTPEPNPKEKLYDLSGNEYVKTPEPITKENYKFKGWHFSYTTDNFNYEFRLYDFSKTIKENLGDIDKYINSSGDIKIYLTASWEATATASSNNTVPATPTPTPKPEPPVEPEPTPDNEPEPTPETTPTPETSPTPETTPTPGETPTPESTPTPEVTPVPTPVPTSTPSPEPVDVNDDPKPSSDPEPTPEESIPTPESHPIILEEEEFYVGPQDNDKETMMDLLGRWMEALKTMAIILSISLLAVLGILGLLLLLLLWIRRVKVQNDKNTNEYEEQNYETVYKTLVDCEGNRIAQLFRKNDRVWQLTIPQDIIEDRVTDDFMVLLHKGFCKHYHGEQIIIILDNEDEEKIRELGFVIDKEEPEIKFNYAQTE